MVGARLNHRFCTRRRGRVVYRNLPGFHAWHQALAEAYPDRPGDHEQIAASTSAGGGFDSTIEGSGGIVRIVCAPVYLVYDPPLRRLGNRGHGEIGVAAQIAQQGDFAFDAAALAIGAGVIQRPVAMDEAEDGAAIVPAQQTVVIYEPGAKLGDLAGKRIARPLSPWRCASS